MQCGSLDSFSVARIQSILEPFVVDPAGACERSPSLIKSSWISSLTNQRRDDGQRMGTAARHENVELQFAKIHCFWYLCIKLFVRLLGMLCASPNDDVIEFTLATTIPKIG